MVFSSVAGNERAQFAKFHKKWEKVANVSRQFIVQKFYFINNMKNFYVGYKIHTYFNMDIKNLARDL